MRAGRTEDLSKVMFAMENTHPSTGNMHALFICLLFVRSKVYPLPQHPLLPMLIHVVCNISSALWDSSVDGSQKKLVQHTGIRLALRSFCLLSYCSHLSRVGLAYSFSPSSRRALTRLQKLLLPRSAL
jgi:hypothetical protein